MVRMTDCRACMGRNLYLFMQMGSHPPANRFLAEDQLDAPEPSFPLDAYACLDCGLIQIPDQIPADFFRHYLYVPSASDTMHRHFAALADRLRDLPGDVRAGRVMDIGCNDGLFLRACLDRGLRTLGVEPAANLAAVARDGGIEVVNDYFTPAVATAIRERYGAARVIVTTNTFNHIGDLHRFTEGVRLLLEDDGTFVVEVPHALDLIERNEFDTIYHEHLSEFSVKSLIDLFNYFDMEVFDIERLGVHGGSMRVFIQKREGGLAPVTPAVAAWVAQEGTGGLFERATYDAFAARVERNRVRLLSLLTGLKASGCRIAGYGAPAKGNTLLNYFGIGTDILDFLADRNPLKHGRYSPGMRIPIASTDAILREQPDYLLILAWNFADEIIPQQEEYRRRGGKFILPVPEPAIID